ncbi:hypothetical protein ACIBTZ_19465 [Micromonospora sp. NPDC049460]|uniref:hypothetical protein n=1 Tax=Micromonospora sp. NPDC049460 TaxID=3364272 RepID=UPI0037B6EC3F
MAEVIAAIVGGVFAVLAAIIAARHQQRTSKRHGRGNGGAATPSPAPPRMAENKGGSVGRDSGKGGGAKVPSERAADRGDNDPEKRELPLHRVGESYRGLSGEDLEVRFLTDAELRVRRGDTFIFDDKAQDR